MKKAELAADLRSYVKQHLSPTAEEQRLVSKVYDAVKSALGESCLLVGSYARFTASRPLHDLDILFVKGHFDPQRLNPAQVLEDLAASLRTRFQNPTPYGLNISLQSHSITITFLDRNKECFAVDIVPAYTSGAKNEFGDDVYWVPEILNIGRRNRRVLYETITKAKRNEIDWWVKSDPRGYIKAATLLNTRNPDFRKVTKLVKKWKHNCKHEFGAFELKSFHIEQMIGRIFDGSIGPDITDVLFRFFCNLPDAIARAQITDRADREKFIDAYVNDLAPAQKARIVEARDAFLIRLEGFDRHSPIEELLRGVGYRRAGRSEAYLFDSGIPVFIDDEIDLRVRGRVLRRDGGFREFVLDAAGNIGVDRKIEFTARLQGPYQPDMYKWKVKNDNACGEPRGEITDGGTRNNPEYTKYKGAHFVECYAIKDGVCVARGRQNVVLGVKPD